MYCYAKTFSTINNSKHETLIIYFLQTIFSCVKTHFKQKRRPQNAT